MEPENEADCLRDPLTMNLRRQARLLFSQIQSTSFYIAPLTEKYSNIELLAFLSKILAVPSLTTKVATAFRPLLVDLCARWLEQEENTEDQLAALCLLLEPHEELYPVLSAFIRRPKFKNGPLGFVITSQSLSSIDQTRLQRLLLAYYRILQANRELPEQQFWPLTPLSMLLSDSQVDTGVRLLAIRCYSLQSGMSEGQREKIETQMLGEICGVDCPIEFHNGLEGKGKDVDGWVMPAIEVSRIQDARNSLLEPQEYYTFEEGETAEPIQASELCPLVANVHGILLLRTHPNIDSTSSLISTPSTTKILQSMATHISLRVPVLLTSAPSSGKSLLISHLSSILHPGVKNQIITIHLADTSLDGRSLLGSYMSSTTRSGVFEWKEGVLVRAMREGKWIVFEDIDRGSSEVLGVIKPLVASLHSGKWIGECASLEVPGRGRIRASEKFTIFATRSLMAPKTGKFPSAAFFGAHKFHEIIVPSPTSEELRTLINAKFPRLAGSVAQLLIRLWEAVRAHGPVASSREVGLRDLEKFCARVDNLLASTPQSMDIDVNGTLSLSDVFPNPTIREDMYLEARDVFFGSGTLTLSAHTHAKAIASTLAEHLAIEQDRRDWILNKRTPEFQVQKDVDGRLVAVFAGRTRLSARSTKQGIDTPSARPFAMHHPAKQLMSRIATSISLGEPILLTGETGTGKTSLITHLASLLNKPLVSLNLSHQTESSDLLGGFKPLDPRFQAALLQARFLNLFSGTFSRKKNVQFEESVRKAVLEGKWKRLVGLWRESLRLAKERILAKQQELSTLSLAQEVEPENPRKRRKLEQGAISASHASWSEFEKDVREFEVHHLHGKGKFAFGFVEGPLVNALRTGKWVLLDEINLASAETLQCISSILQGPTSSITLTEQGSLEPVPRHPDFLLFACMNPATDVGKKDLPLNIRCLFTEIDVPSPDRDRETLISIVTQYIGPNAVGDKAIIMNVAEFYTAVKKLAEERLIVDGSNHRPHYSVRTLARALSFAAEMASMYSLRRSLWEGCLMAFTMVLDSKSAETVTILAKQHLLADVRNARSLLLKEPSLHSSKSENFVKFGPFYLERGPLAEDLMEDYIMTPSVETKLIDLARIMVTRKFPVLIEGPTSSGKTSSVEYLARRTGHHFIRINNHEHTDIQEYLGSYVSDPTTGKLVFRDGLLVRALRNGDWIVLDELNLAPTDVLEALNRLLDDNRELFIPETHEAIRPHPHFMLFATQNPPGLYAGRKVLSRAFRNRFLEVHFKDVPQTELETILCQRCRIAPSYGQRIVAVFRELQKRRQTSRVFESKNAFATLRDLFRWAGRDAVGYQELAENGYMLLAERVRRDDDKTAVKEVIESVMKVKINEASLYSFQQPSRNISSYLGFTIPAQSDIVWTKAMQRLFVLVSRALRFNEPVLLVGETGSGKTSVCQVLADSLSKKLYSLNCHQNTETADLIGGLRPLRNRTETEAKVLLEAVAVLEHLGLRYLPTIDVQSMLSNIDNALKSLTRDSEDRSALSDVRRKLVRLNTIFEWHDGPIVEAMRSGDVFLLDEISLADDSVLERLNSVLEPARMIVLAERSGDDVESPIIQASEGFKLVATMNPGGDFGKKELSPALRNRFTEIWVPAVEDRRDLQMIVDSTWKNSSLKRYTTPLLNFADWLRAQVSNSSLLGLRDILGWVAFCNAVAQSGDEEIRSDAIFHHGAHMTLLDGLGSQLELSAYSHGEVERLKLETVQALQRMVPLIEDTTFYSFPPSHSPASYTQLGSFAIPRGQEEPIVPKFNLRAPTTRNNAMRVARACQLLKPILLEGSPGVGKTSLVMALANISGYRLCRINLSDQTDLTDLFGSDLPVEGGKHGEFAWKDAAFLRAMQKGDWVLLDEMNLAPQAVLEGLNAVLDHRGAVYIPELGRSFTRHPNFRIFAAQNPLRQGGGRKGLPKSFVNRFTKVYLDELSSEDLVLVCSDFFPHLDSDMLRTMIRFNGALNEEIEIMHTFGREGGPWEFNLRDISRWATLISATRYDHHPAEHHANIYLQRFRNLADRECASSLFSKIFSMSPQDVVRSPTWEISASHIQAGRLYVSRTAFTPPSRPGSILQAQLYALESAGFCVSQAWPCIITGGPGSGKKEIIRILAQYTGNTLREISINSATDTLDLLGSFEQSDEVTDVQAVANRVLALLEKYSRSSIESPPGCVDRCTGMRKALSTAHYIRTSSPIIQMISQALGELELKEEFAAECAQLRIETENLLHFKEDVSRFKWMDGPLVRAIKNGHWLLLNGANLCNPSVLDRLNSLCEPNGLLTLTERGYVDGNVQVLKPHSNFRLFMSIDPQYGELSRAMRNRGMEIALVVKPNAQDLARLRDFFRLPTMTGNARHSMIAFDAARRGIHHQNPGEHKNASFSSTYALCNDTTLSKVVQQTSAMSLNTPSSDSHTAHLEFFARVLSPAYSAQFHRYISEVDPEGALSAKLRRLLHELRGSHFLDVIQEMRSAFGVLREIPSSHLSASHLDFYLTCPLGNTQMTSTSAHRFILLTLSLFVALLVDNECMLSSNYGKSLVSETNLSIHSSRIAQERSEAVLFAVHHVGREILNNLDYENKLAKMEHLELATTLLHHARSLRMTLSTTAFDYSAAQALTKSILNELKSCSAPFTEVHNSARALQDVIASSSGQALMEIWSSLLVDRPNYVSDDELDWLDSMACRIKNNLDARAARKQTFDLMVVLTSTTENDEKALALVQANVKGVLTRDGLCLSDGRRESEASMLIVELRMLSAIHYVSNNRQLKYSGLIDDILEVAEKDVRGSLLRLVSYRNALLAGQSGKVQPANIAQLLSKWLEALWTAVPSEALPAGPSAIWTATQLRNTAHLCSHRHQPLSCLSEYEANLERSICFAFLQSKERAPRRDQMLSLLHQSILLLHSCFAQESDDIASLGGLSTSELISLIDRAANTTLMDAVNRLLRPALLSLTHDRPSQFLKTLGDCWIGLSRVILSLYIPDHPVDPAAIQLSLIEFWRQEERILETQIRLHVHYEEMALGSSSNFVIAYVEERLALIRNSLAGAPASATRGKHEVSSLHAFWSEVAQFQFQVIDPSKIDSLVLLLKSGDRTALVREQVVQQSIEGFLKRFKSVYPTFMDIIAPLQLGLLQLRFGLRLLSDSMHQILDDPVCRATEAVVAFPSAYSSSLLQSLPAGVAGLPIFQYVLLNLSAISVASSGCIDLTPSIEAIEALYAQAFQIWRTDRARENDNASSAQSLYRSKRLDFEAASEAAIEEQELMSLFPHFDSILDLQDPSSADPKSQLLPSDNIAQTHRLVEIHLALFGSHTLLRSPASKLFAEARKSTLSYILSQHSSIPDTADVKSLSFQFSLLKDRYTELKRPSSTCPPSNFYFDANVAEARKAALVIEAFTLRVEALADLWPEQMVLQNLKDRCNSALTLDLRSPVASLLSAVEQLLLQSEDWEMYANRENTLKPHQQAMTSLIIDWRRLELSCWQALLQAEATAFSKSSSEWWYNLYDAVIHVPLNLVDSAAGGDASTLTEYLVKLVPLLEDFIRSSSLGQFESRMKLLRSFSTLSRHLVHVKSGPFKIAMQRIERILWSTSNFYEAFSGKVSEHLIQQQIPLQKEIQAFVKLASWKDVNVHALKQSAKRSHHQLYKIIRKYRDILRQPVMSLLQPDFVGNSDSKPLVANFNINSATSHKPAFPDSGSLTLLPDHLLNLPRTFERFDSLIDKKISNSIRHNLALWIDELAVEIISTAETLRSTSFSNTDPTRSGTSQHKALLVRKRKAWSDLLKELKRAGLSANSKPDVLQRQGSLLWIREQILSVNVDFPSMSLEKGEMYFNRLQACLPALRASVANHHTDLNTRELMRATFLLESGFTLALDSRECLLQALREFQKLHRASRRLEAFTSSSQLHFVDGNFYPNLVLFGNMFCKLTNTLEEAIGAIETVDELRSNSAVSSTAIETVRDLWTAATIYLKRLADIIQDVESLSLSVLTESEYDTISKVLRHVELADHSLGQVAEDETCLRHIITPIQGWIHTQEWVPELLRSDSKEDNLATGNSEGVIDVLLVRVQHFLQAASLSVDDSPWDEKDRWINEDLKFTLKLTHLLGLDIVNEALDAHLTQLAASPASQFKLRIGRFLPFLTRYQQLAQKQLTSHCQSTNAIFKLDYILCSVMFTIATKGFCKPPELEDSGSGEDNSEIVDGVGVGEGSGNTNASADIEDESQVEGLQGETREPENCVEDGEDNDAIEMSHDIGGELQDVPQPEAEDEQEPSEETPRDVDEQMEKLDSSDPSTVDEKLWGGEPPPSDDENEGRDTSDSQSKRQEHESDVVAKEKQDAQKQSKSEAEQSKETPDHNVPEEQFSPDTSEAEGEERADGAPVDDFLQEGEPLDLPEGMDLDFGEERNDREEYGDDISDSSEADTNSSAPVDEQESTDPTFDKGEAVDDDEGLDSHGMLKEADDQTSPDDHADDENVVAQPDIDAAGDATQPHNNAPNSSIAQNASADEGGGSGTAVGQGPSSNEKEFNESQGPDNGETTSESRRNEDQKAGSGADGVQNGPANSQQQDKQLAENSARKIGDLTREVQQRHDDILGAGQEQTAGVTEAPRLEYVLLEDADQDMQALGSAGDEQAAHLKDLNLVEGPQDEAINAMEVDTAPPFEKHELPRNPFHLPDPTTFGKGEDQNGASTHADLENPRSHDAIPTFPRGPGLPKAEEERENLEDGDVETRLRQWQSDSQSERGAEHMWRLYESLTHDLAYALCEQLRLILEPTLATRMKGDYRTGKRLNMKKIIPYIASDFTKDKIWLRRTKPSQREYQVLIALDDSRSMAESHSVHLAYQTLALVSTALSRLEVGDIAIARFGEAVEILHSFDEGPFTGTAGAKVMSAFKFNQQATNVVELVNGSLKVLELARERRSMSSSSAGDLWQLEIIISDGICQDHDRLRTILRKAEDQRVMIVFIIVDSLHSAANVSNKAPEVGSAQQNSILHMNQVSYKNVDGRMELQMDRYLDSFPFEYYVVLRNADALPEVLSSTLKQFFERLSEI